MNTLTTVYHTYVRLHDVIFVVKNLFISKCVLTTSVSIQVSFRFGNGLM